MAPGSHITPTPPTDITDVFLSPYRAHMTTSQELIQVLIAFCKTLEAGIQPLSVIIHPLKSHAIALKSWNLFHAITRATEKL